MPPVANHFSWHHGYRNQVVELQKHLEQERQLRGITERMLKETQQAVIDAAKIQVVVEWRGAPLVAAPRLDSSTLTAAACSLCARLGPAASRARECEPPHGKAPPGDGGGRGPAPRRPRAATGPHREPRLPAHGDGRPGDSHGRHGGHAAATGAAAFGAAAAAGRAHGSGSAPGSTGNAASTAATGRRRGGRCRARQRIWAAAGSERTRRLKGSGQRLDFYRREAWAEPREVMEMRRGVPLFDLPLLSIGEF